MQKQGQEQQRKLSLETPMKAFFAALALVSAVIENAETRARAAKKAFIGVSLRGLICSVPQYTGKSREGKLSFCQGCILSLISNRLGSVKRLTFKNCPR